MTTLLHTNPSTTATLAGSWRFAPESALRFVVIGGLDTNSISLQQREANTKPSKMGGTT